MREKKVLKDQKSMRRRPESRVAGTHDFLRLSSVSERPFLLTFGFVYHLLMKQNSIKYFHGELGREDFLNVIAHV